MKAITEDIQTKKENLCSMTSPVQWSQSWGGYSDTLDFVNFSVIHNQMIDTNGLWNFKTTYITLFLAIADELKQ